MQFDKDTEEAFFVEDPNPDAKDDLDKLEHTTVKFISFQDLNAKTNMMDKCLTMEFTFTPKIFMADDYEAYL